MKRSNCKTRPPESKLRTHKQKRRLNILGRANNGRRLIISLKYHYYRSNPCFFFPCTLRIMNSRKFKGKFGKKFISPPPGPTNNPNHVRSVPIRIYNAPLATRKNLFFQLFNFQRGVGEKWGMIEEEQKLANFSEEE